MATWLDFKARSRPYASLTSERTLLEGTLTVLRREQLGLGAASAGTLFKAGTAKNQP
jgi:hypothetical protein